MKKFSLFILLFIPVILNAQSDRKLIRQGCRSYEDGNYNEAEVEFRKAEEANKESFIAKYNTSTALYQQEKIEESAERFEELLAETTDDKDEAMLYHNIGNSLLETNKLEESIDAYKKSLRLNPSDEDTRYNLTYALEKLQEQQQDQENKDGEKNEDEQQGDKNEDPEDPEDQGDENKDQQDQNSDQNKEEEKEQNQPQQLSKEDAERLLDAILQKEKDVKEKVDKKKAAAAKIKTDKDW